MNPNRIDFAPRTVWRAVAMTRPLTWLFAITGLALCISAAVAVLEFKQQHSVRQARLERVQTQVAENIAHISTPQKNTISEAQAGAVNDAVEQLNLPWSGLMDAIERATPATVALLELAPDAKRHVLKGVAEAKTSDMMIAFIGRLKQESLFGSVVLTRHEINDQDANRPYRFEFEAEWMEVAR